jgi:hypothetical protein
MSLAKKAQQFWEDDAEDVNDTMFVTGDPPEEGGQAGFEDMDPLDMFDADEDDITVEEPDDEDLEGEMVIQVDDEEPEVFSFTLPELPGAEGDIEIDDGDIEVEEGEDEVEVAERDMWDWESGGVGSFLQWLQGMFNSIPKYHGDQTTGVERAVAFLSKLDSAISKAVRSDLKEELDISQVENARREIRSGIKRLNERLDRLTVGDKKKKANSDADYRQMLVKEAQKISGVSKTTITVDILLARVAKTCINGMVSAGHDIEDLFDRQVKKYSLDVREQASVMQLLEDMGYPLRRDRGFLRDEEIDRTRSDNFDWNANYPA